MEAKILKFVNSIETYRKLADKKADAGDFASALGLLFAAKKADGNSLGVIEDIADAYADMGALEYSNKFWYYYLDKAPKHKLPVAYEELAINYFYMDNLWASGYFFHQKIKADGFIAKEGLDQEIIDFFSETEMRNSLYHIAYPFSRADFSVRIRAGKRALSSGDFKTAEAVLASVPTECRDEDTDGELAVACFLSKKDKELVEVCKDSLLKHGENATAYCNLSSLYHDKKDREKSAYYYNKALETRKFTPGEAYKIATCAIEQCDDKTVNFCIKKIMEERSFDLIMKLFYGISFINLGDYSSAARELNECRRIFPFDFVVSYYCDLSFKLEEGDAAAQKLLPLKYSHDLPDKVTKKYKKIIKESLSGSAIKKTPDKDALRWGIRYGDQTLAKESIFLASMFMKKESEKLFTEMLVDPEICDETKRVLIFSLVVGGYKERFGVVAGNLFTKIKPRKLLFDNEGEGELFASAYALTLARTAFWDIDDKDKTAFAVNKLFTLHRKTITDSQFSAEQVAALIVIMCGYEKFRSDKDVCSAFGVKYADLAEFIKVIKGAENG